MGFIRISLAFLRHKCCVLDVMCNVIDTINFFVCLEDEGASKTFSASLLINYDEASNCMSASDYNRYWLIRKLLVHFKFIIFFYIITTINNQLGIDLLSISRAVGLFQRNSSPQKKSVFIAVQLAVDIFQFPSLISSATSKSEVNVNNTLYDKSTWKVTMPEQTERQLHYLFKCVLFAQ